MLKYEYEIKYILDRKGIKYINRGDSLKVKCINPSHNDNNPSCFINLNTGLWHCFSCGAKGNLFSLQNILLKEKIFSTDYTKPKNKKIKYPDIKIIGNLYDPRTNVDVMNFLKSIGITSDYFLDKYKVQYTNYAEMISEELYYDYSTSPTKMKDRICIPITHNGKIINYECRTFIGEQPKVKYVKGGSVDTLFNWENIDTSKRVILVESVKNFSKLWNVYPNSIAMFHAIPTKKQLKMLNMCKEICLFADNDKAGLEDAPKKIRENYDGLFYITHDSRTYTVVENGVNKIKGFDCNDCSLDEISNHLDKATLYKANKILW